jgi:hypothetical protein
MIPPSTEPSGYVYLDEMVRVLDINIPDNPNLPVRQFQEGFKRIGGSTWKTSTTRDAKYHGGFSPRFSFVNLRG